MKHGVSLALAGCALGMAGVAFGQGAILDVVANKVIAKHGSVKVR